jgi:putative FmdB family regulatory protein
MPIYEYACKKCQERTSVLVRSFSATPASVVCEHCGSTELERAFSSSSVIMGPLNDAKRPPWERRDQTPQERAMRQAANVAVQKAMERYR